MSILTMLWKNLWGGNRTMLFPARPKASKGYRGVVQFNPEFCGGCAICKFRCTARAIEFKAGKGEFVWSYDPGQCTFCGRCVEGCIEHAHKEGRTEYALSQESAPPPIYLTLGELKHAYTVKRKPPVSKAAAPTAATPPAPAAVPPSAAPQSPNPVPGDAQ